MHLGNYIAGLLEHATTLSLPVVLIGYFNISLSELHPSGRQFLDTIQSFGCSNVITAPTRLPVDSASLIDLCITSNMPSETISGIFAIR